MFTFYYILYVNKDSHQSKENVRYNNIKMQFFLMSLNYQKWLKYKESSTKYINEFVLKALEAKWS